MVLDKEILQAKQRFSIIGNAPALLRAIGRAIRVAPIDLSVLITGESGAGKEFFPKIIHQFGARKHKKYIAVNCGAIPEGTIDSELFGHEKGSFTGAISARKGYFEEADGGTIFLDEVAELPLTTQARLLRVLESGEFLKVGSSTVQKTNIRIVAATNVDLLKAVEKGKFREDLYYRLSTIRIDVPNLHDRGEDISLLARKFAADFSEKYMTRPISFSDEALRAMLVYRWPGNVRQLKNLVEQFALFEAGEEISRRQVLEALPLDRSANSTPAPTKKNVDYESEREMLWQLMLGMKAEIADLKRKLSSPLPDTASKPTSLPDTTSKREFSSPLPDADTEAKQANPTNFSEAGLYPEEDFSKNDFSENCFKENSFSKDSFKENHFSKDSYNENRFKEDGLCESGSSKTSPSTSLIKLPVKDLLSPISVPAPSQPISLLDSEKETIAAALARNNGNRKKAAEELDISLRTLYRKIQDFGIE